MPFVRRAFGAQAIGDLGVEKARNRAEERNPRQREIPARVEAGLARPSGVALLRGRLRIVGAGDERGRLAREHPFARRPELLPQAQS